MMGGEHWPKEGQRLRNGASGQVPIAGREASPSIGGGFLDLGWLRLEHDPSDATTPEHKAIDAANRILCESLDMAQHVIGHSLPVRGDVLALAMAHAQIAVKVLAVNEFVAVLREVAPEIVGAIGEAGTDIGAGILGCVEQVLKQQNEISNNG